MPGEDEIPGELDEDGEGFDQIRWDEVREFTPTQPFRVGLDPLSYQYDLDFPFPEMDGDLDGPQWCVWEGMPDPNEDSGVLWESLEPYGLTAAAAQARVGDLLADWLDVPEGAVLSLRRQMRAGARAQWAIVPGGDGGDRGSGGGLDVLEARIADGAWQETGAGPFASIADALAAIPALRTLRKGAVYRYDLGVQAGIDERRLAAMLDLCPQDGSDDPGGWSQAELDACEWEDFDVWRQAADLPLVRRLASIGDLDLSGIDHGRRCTPVLAEEDDFVPLEVVASTATYDHPGISMVAGDGGCRLVLLAPGLACNVPWGDERQYGEIGFFLLNFPEQEAPQEVAAALADWITRVGFEFWAALVLEPLDPDSTATREQLAAWEDFQGRLSASPALDVPEGTVPLLRAELSRRSESYRRTAEARAEPSGHAAEALLASDQPDLHYGNWVKDL